MNGKNYMAVIGVSYIAFDTWLAFNNWKAAIFLTILMCQFTLATIAAKR